MKIPHEDHVAADLATGQQQLFSLRGPIEVEYSTGNKLGYLPGRSASNGLLHDVSGVPDSEKILQSFSGWRPAEAAFAVDSRRWVEGLDE